MLDGTQQSAISNQQSAISSQQSAVSIQPMTTMRLHRPDEEIFRAECGWLSAES
jgi:hypothetical protein